MCVGVSMNISCTVGSRRWRYAVLVDGENISSSFSDDILHQVATAGEAVVRRVYGNATSIKGWEALPGFQFVHTGCGKNSADMKLAIDAMDLAHSGDWDGIVIVTSDGDFSHLGHALRERGLQVLGLGEAKAPERFRAACTAFVQLGIASVTPEIPKIKAGSLSAKLVKVIASEGGEHGLKIEDLNGIMRREHNVQISKYSEKTWRGFLEKRAQVFACDPKGVNAKVRLTKSGSALIAA